MLWWNAPFVLSLASAVHALDWQQLWPSFDLAGDQAILGTRPQNRFLNDNTKEFAVNGSGIPEVDFDVGESYAGLLPIGDADDTNKLYFWFFPSTNRAAKKEILIWLTGGPGCSSTGELLSENGPFLWAPGVFRPVANKWSWHHLTNVVWVDQPIGSGFSQGEVTARNEEDVARQFMGFWRNFVDAFALHGYKVYVTGSSYSGMYCPYVAAGMLDAADPRYFDVAGMMVFDGVLAKFPVSQDIPMAGFVDAWRPVFGFNDSFAQTLHEASDRCGYDAYMQTYLTYPPSGPQPDALPGHAANGSALPGCDVFDAVVAAARELNPCFSVYSIFARCPAAYDPLGFGDGSYYQPAGSGPAYFDRVDVKKAINAPVDQPWAFCPGEGGDDDDDSSTPVFVNGTDESLLGGPASQPVLPGVIERTRNVVIAHGSQDLILLPAGTLLAIQNMTWGRKLGFQEKPAAPAYVPYHGGNGASPTSAAGAGVVGTAHTERGLTYLGVSGAGHFVSQDVPAVAFRALEILLGRVAGGFASRAPFTTDADATAQPDGPMGRGTMPEAFVAGGSGEG